MFLIKFLCVTLFLAVGMMFSFFLFVSAVFYIRAGSSFSTYVNNELNFIIILFILD